ncbi:hypothetical protein Tco_0619576 [Tanacetum coccineum]
MDGSRCYRYTLDVQRMSRDAIVVHEMFNGCVEMLSLYIRCSTEDSRCYRYTLDVQLMSRDAIVVHEMFNGRVEMLSLYIRCSTEESRCYHYTWGRTRLSCQVNVDVVVLGLHMVNEWCWTNVTERGVHASITMQGSNILNPLPEPTDRPKISTSADKFSSHQLLCLHLVELGQHGVVMDLLAPYQIGGRIRLFGGDVGKTVLIKELINNIAKAHGLLHKDALGMVRVLQKSFEELKQARTRDKELFEQDKEESKKQYKERLKSHALTNASENVYDILDIRMITIFESQQPLNANVSEQESQVTSAAIPPDELYSYVFASLDEEMIADADCEEPEPAPFLITVGPKTLDVDLGSAID